MTRRPIHRGLHWFVPRARVGTPTRRNAFSTVRSVTSKCLAIEASDWPASYIAVADSDVVVGQDPVPGLDAGSLQDGEDGRPVDVERVGQSVGGLAGRVALEDLGSVGIGQSGLFLADRWEDPRWNNARRRRRAHDRRVRTRAGDASGHRPHYDRGDREARRYDAPRRHRRSLPGTWPRRRSTLDPTRKHWLRRYDNHERSRSPVPRRRSERRQDNTNCGQLDSRPDPDPIDQRRKHPSGTRPTPIGRVSHDSGIKGNNEGDLAGRLRHQ